MANAEIRRSGPADILDSMLFVQMNKTHAARTQTIAGSIDRELDRAFTNEHNLGVHVTVRSAAMPASSM